MKNSTKIILATLGGLYVAKTINDARRAKNYEFISYRSTPFEGDLSSNYELYFAFTSWGIIAYCFLCPVFAEFFLDGSLLDKWKIALMAGGLVAADIILVCFLKRIIVGTEDSEKIELLLKEKKINDSQLDEISFYKNRFALLAFRFAYIASPIYILVLIFIGTNIFGLYYSHESTVLFIFTDTYSRMSPWFFIFVVLFGFAPIIFSLVLFSSFEDQINPILKEFYQDALFHYEEQRNNDGTIGRRLVLNVTGKKVTKELGGLKSKETGVRYIKSSFLR